MFKFRLFGVAVMAAVLASGAISQAATRHRVKQTAKVVRIFASATYPNPGSKAVNAGTISGKPASGAVVQHITITGHPTATTYTLKATATDFYAHGMTRSSFSAVAIAQPSGALTVAGHGHCTGGTGAYRGARGTFSFAGAAPPSAPLVAHLRGTIRY
jgi:hypothetical protein